MCGVCMRGTYILNNVKIKCLSTLFLMNVKCMSPELLCDAVLYHVFKYACLFIMWEWQIKIHWW